ncbi:hypothetical protein FNAPI_2567 [Fusarium napiforme]|uniref:Uncharacterized protein n=1 Tax=Fusarium napiforme TaxID=42672 RepID=A0A8H5JXT4_9HYPO|nr:hypothetical protein FNAPI_2567 [Fusarium napiforme]
MESIWNKFSGDRAAIIEEAFSIAKNRGQQEWSNAEKDVMSQAANTIVRSLGGDVGLTFVEFEVLVACAAHSDPYIHLRFLDNLVSVIRGSRGIGSLTYYDKQFMEFVISTHNDRIAIARKNAGLDVSPGPNADITQHVPNEGNDKRQPLNLMAKSGSLIDRMGQDATAQDHRPSCAASGDPATSWNQESLERKQPNFAARKGPVIFSPQTDSRALPQGSRVPPAPTHQEAAPYGAEIPQRSTSTRSQESQHFPFVQWYIGHRLANPRVRIPTTATQEIVKSDSEEIAPPKSKSKSKSRIKSKTRHGREKSRHETSSE